MLNSQEVMKRVIKYLVQGLMVAFACFAIPKKSLEFEEIALIALVAAATFSILDTYMPTVPQPKPPNVLLNKEINLSSY
jgi:hypothetical protein